MEPPIRIFKQPALRNPSLIIGWADAGLVGINTIDYLIEKLDAEELGGIDSHDFSLLPDVVIKKSVIKDIEYTNHTFYYWENNKDMEDLLLLGSRPPDMNHYKFANLILDVAELFHVKRIFTVGGLYTDVSHTEIPRISAVINDSDLKDYLKPYDVDLSMNYHGQSSINGLIIGIAKRRNIDGISLWGNVPSYIGEIPNPQICEAILKVLTKILNIDIDFDDIEAEANYTNKQINELVAYLRQQDPSFNKHIDKLEKGIIIETSDEERQKFFEEIDLFLKKQDDHHENNSTQ
ncbi:PAC2 family protein [Chloroflexota bacterium]